MEQKMKLEMDLSIARFIKEQWEREEEEKREEQKEVRSQGADHLYAGGIDRGHTKQTAVSLYAAAGI